MVPFTTLVALVLVRLHQRKGLYEFVFPFSRNGCLCECHCDPYIRKTEERQFPCVFVLVFGRKSNVWV